MEMNSNINRATDGRQNAMDQLAIFQEMRDEEICQQTGVQLMPDGDGSVVSNYGSEDEGGRLEYESKMDDNLGLTKQKL